MGATIAVIGLGRIGAFHAETLSGLPGVDELVVTDERPEVTAAVADKLGARGPGGAGRRGGRGGARGRDTRSCAADPGRGRGRDPGVLRETDRVYRRREPRGGGPAGGFDGAGADR